MEHGAIDISMFYDASGFENNTLNGKSFYQTKYSGTMAQRMANHCVTIVGWDANYPGNTGTGLLAMAHGLLPTAMAQNTMIMVTSGYHIMNHQYVIFLHLI